MTEGFSCAAALNAFVGCRLREPHPGIRAGRRGGQERRTFAVKVRASPGSATVPGFGGAALGLRQGLLMQVFSAEPDEVRRKVGHLVGLR